MAKNLTPQWLKEGYSSHVGGPGWAGGLLCSIWTFRDPLSLWSSLWVFALICMVKGGSQAAPCFSSWKRKVVRRMPVSCLKSQAWNNTCYFCSHSPGHTQRPKPGIWWSPAVTTGTLHLTQQAKREHCLLTASGSSILLLFVFEQYKSLTFFIFYLKAILRLHFWKWRFGWPAFLGIHAGPAKHHFSFPPWV